MFLRIEKGSAVPISKQIEQQIATRCAAGTLKPGERLPSVREMARQLSVNQNTVLRVYERLVRDLILEMRQGQGTFVAADAQFRATSGHRERLIEELRQLSRQALGLGLTNEEIHQLLDAALEQLRSLNNSSSISTSKQTKEVTS
ncbi:GntR family transcriptional regulator [Adhaeretor mobilis]|uniref:HTH-type transcriptional repressor YtrA n=1 Tax=Adhaeretor mobilis TaxID=1930276 RepID=A0A517MSI3_9BACT|nr:GntR family transcriptional regulator [Adhaeretor mobilis]QDS97842.1 HTH-type transcriptional repressor YtrA [Adhaeretor mobilis]